MFRRGKRALAMAPVVPLPTGNVALVDGVHEDGHWALPTQRAENAADSVPEVEDGAEAVPIGWSIRRPDGEIVRAHIASRAEASRMLGSLAAHGAALPLVVHGPDGKSIGEQLG